MKLVLKDFYSIKNFVDFDMFWHPYIHSCENGDIHDIHAEFDFIWSD